MADSLATAFELGVVLGGPLVVAGMASKGGTARRLAWALGGVTWLLTALALLSLLGVALRLIPPAG